jgi:ArsR family transcriptional regulator
MNTRPATRTPAPRASKPTARPFDADQLAALCKAGGEPLRLDILRVLSRDSFGVLELCQIFDCSQPGMSHHLKVLSEAGLVSKRREGNSIFYRRAFAEAGSELDALQRALLDTVDRLPIVGVAQRRLLKVQNERVLRSQEFFSDNAAHFREHQELIAAYDLYGPQAAELVASCFPTGGECALEVGPGEGAFLIELARKFRRVVALDNVEAMLNRARQTAVDARLGNVEFLHGDTHHAALRQLQADCAVLNMVLHHVSSPAELFVDLQNALRPGGTLIVTELCHHNQEWAQQSCGDVWLGFEPEELDQWALAAGFNPGRSVYLAQRNGFRVQVRQFVRAN